MQPSHPPTGTDAPSSSPVVGPQRQPEHDRLSGPERARAAVEVAADRRLLRRTALMTVPLLLALVGAIWLLDYRGLNPFGTSPAAVPPAGLPVRGTYVAASVRPGGSVQVTQWVRAPERSRTVTLGVQPGAGAGARATGVRVSAGTRRATGPSSVGHQGVTYRVDRAAPLFRIRYTLSHVVDRRSSTASTTVLASSFLAVRTPPRSGRTVVDVTGPGVRSTSCRAVLGPTHPRPCGERLGGTSDRTGRWHVELVGRELTDRVRVEVGAF